MNTLHPSETQYHNIHWLVRPNDIPPEIIERLAAEQNRLIVEAIGAVPDALQFIYSAVILGSLVHDVNALRGLVGEPEAVAFTDIWPSGEKAPCITTMLRYSDGLRVLYTIDLLQQVVAAFNPPGLGGEAKRR